MTIEKRTPRDRKDIWKESEILEENVWVETCSHVRSLQLGLSDPMNINTFIAAAAIQVVTEPNHDEETVQEEIMDIATIYQNQGKIEEFARNAAIFHRNLEHFGFKLDTE
jgi:hypothetical protein